MDNETHSDQALSVGAPFTRSKSGPLGIPKSFVQSSQCSVSPASCAFTMCLRRLVAVALTALAFCAWPALGDEHPVIEEVSLMEMPGDVQTPTALNIVVTLRGDAVPGPALGDVTVAVQYRVMFCVQQNASLARLSADTNIWHGSLSSSGGRNISTGDLFQYRVLLATAGAVVDADPPGLDNNNATRMHTWIVGFGEIFNSSAVPPLLWYTQDFERSRWDYPTPGAFAFADGGGKLHYYSASEVHREGSGRKDGPVKLQSQEVCALFVVTVCL